VYPLATGCVGSGVALEFTTFTKCSSKLVKPEDIVKNPSTARIPSKTEVYVLFATVSSLEYYINLPENHKYWDKALEYVLRPELEAEFGLLIAKAATVIALSKLPEAERAKAPQNQWFKKMYTLYGKYLANPEG